MIYLKLSSYFKVFCYSYQKRLIKAFVFDVRLECCWCVRFAASMRKTLFVTYSLNGCLESVLYWCWHKLHGSKVSRESDLRSVPNNRPVGVRSFVKNAKSLSENQHNP